MLERTVKTMPFSISIMMGASSCNQGQLGVKHILHILGIYMAQTPVSPSNHSNTGVIPFRKHMPQPESSVHTRLHAVLRKPASHNSMALVYMPAVLHLSVFPNQ